MNGTSRHQDDSSGHDMASLSKPTILEVWSPSCGECRAMQPELDAMALRFAGRVDLNEIDASRATQVARDLGVLGTPTLIGVRDGEEMFRFTGRRSRSELEELFTAVSTGDTFPHPGRQDMLIRVGAGVALAGLGALTGPVWALVAVGAGVTALGLASWIRR